MGPDIHLKAPDTNPLYIRNRLLTSSVTEAGATTPLVTNTYDNYGPPVNNPIVNINNLRDFDYTYSTTYLTRGNVTSSQTLAGVTSVTQIDITGNVLQSTNPQGVSSSSSVTLATNYAAPSSITVGSLTSTFSYAADLLPTQTQGPNGDTASTTYDSYARPTQSTSKTGATTYFNYSNAPAMVLTFTNPNSNSLGRITRTTLDGFGRAVKAESGTGTYSNNTITVSQMLSEVYSTYAPCGCSPLGKLTLTSRPLVPGATKYWTTYAYDGIGRTTSVTAPDGASKTTYYYAGAVVTVTDAANKWKTFTTDAVGNLTQVQEPDPNLGTVTTSYTYDVLNNLRTVSMPRNGTTQTRTFTYNTSGQVVTATNPENGTVTNTYNSDKTLNYKTDAKGQKIAYTYDSYKRVTQISKYPDGVNEDVCQRVNYYFDSNPDTTNGNYTQYIAGRLTSVHYGGANCQTFLTQSSTATTGNNYIELYAYTQAGQVVRKTFRLTKQVNAFTPQTVSGDLEAVYTYL